MDCTKRRRDPILQINIQGIQPKIYKAPVPSYMKVSSWLESKPKGIGRGEFCAQSEGSFRVGKDDLSSFRPTRKVYPVRPPYILEKPEGPKKLVPQIVTNPILEPEFESRTSRKKVLSQNTAQIYQDDMRCMSSTRGKQES